MTAWWDDGVFSKTTALPPCPPHSCAQNANEWGLGGFDYPVQIDQGVPVATCTQLEQIIPPLDVVSVERTPTLPSGDRLVVLVMGTGGFVMGCVVGKPLRAAMVF